MAWLAFVHGMSTLLLILGLSWLEIAYPVFEIRNRNRTPKQREDAKRLAFLLLGVGATGWVLTLRRSRR